MGEIYIMGSKLDIRVCKACWLSLNVNAKAHWVYWPSLGSVTELCSIMNSLQKGQSQATAVAAHKKLPLESLQSFFELAPLLCLPSDPRTVASMHYCPVPQPGHTLQTRSALPHSNFCRPPTCVDAQMHSRNMQFRCSTMPSSYGLMCHKIPCWSCRGGQMHQTWNTPLINGALWFKINGEYCNCCL